jgi:hypothetical protein
MSDDNRARHTAFLQDNLEELLKESLIGYQQYGRGLWLFSATQTKNDEQGDEYVDGAYIDSGGVADLMKPLHDDPYVTRIKGMITAYDPEAQAVVLFHERDDSLHVYTVGGREAYGAYGFSLN